MHAGIPVVELYNASSLTMVGDWVLAVAPSETGQDWGYAAVRPVLLLCVMADLWSAAYEIRRVSGVGWCQV